MWFLVHALAVAGLPWGDRPVFVGLFPDDARIREAARDADVPFDALRAQVEPLRREAILLGRLEGPVLSPSQHNAAAAELALRELHVLGAWPELFAWAEDAWGADRPTRLPPPPGTALSLTVFGTQFESFSDDEVALPDYCLKFVNWGWGDSLGRCGSGYNESWYEVTLTLDGVSHTTWVGDAGPWNIDDNYWNGADHPERPRRDWSDLPTGTPEAEAAYYDGYNGGLDQYGRTVTNPSAVDLALDTASALGLAYLENAWITVTYLWEVEADDPPPEDTGEPTEEEEEEAPGDTASSMDTGNADSADPGGSPDGFTGPPGESVLRSELDGGCGCGGGGSGWWLLALPLLLARRGYGSVSPLPRATVLVGASRSPRVGHRIG